MVNGEVAVDANQASQKIMHAAATVPSLFLARALSLARARALSLSLSFSFCVCVFVAQDKAAVVR